MSKFKPASYYRDMLSPEDIKNILRKFGVEPVKEYPDFIIYPTVNHNLEGGSPKLYYYKKNRMFKVYTGDAGLFDIFQLVIDMHHLRGKTISLRQAIAFCGIDIDEPIEDNEQYGVREQLQYLSSLNEEEEEITPLVEYPMNYLSKYIFDLNGISSWIEEGISVETLRKYDIKYDQVDNAIIIPYYSFNNKLVGVRGRFLSEDARAKYMPMRHSGKYLVHPTGRILYGLNVNKKSIQEKRIAIIFEGEKSVMKMDTYFGKDSVAVATSGRTFTKKQLDLLLQLGVKEIVIAFDRDYESINAADEELKALTRSLRFAYNLVNISIIIDYEFLLGHKDSPIDDGKEVFDTLMERRIFI